MLIHVFISYLSCVGNSVTAQNVYAENSLKKKEYPVYMSVCTLGASGRHVIRFSVCAANPTQGPGWFFFFFFCFFCSVFIAPRSLRLISPLCSVVGSYSQRAGAENCSPAVRGSGWWSAAMVTGAADSLWCPLV